MSTDDGNPHNVVARQFSVVKSTIMRIVSRVGIARSVLDRNRLGQPRLTIKRQDINIRQRHLRDRVVTAISMADLILGRQDRPIHYRKVKIKAACASYQVLQAYQKT